MKRRGFLKALVVGAAMIYGEKPISGGLVEIHPAVAQTDRMLAEITVRLINGG